MSVLNTSVLASNKTVLTYSKFVIILNTRTQKQIQTQNSDFVNLGYIDFEKREMNHIKSLT